MTDLLTPSQYLERKREKRKVGIPLPSEWAGSQSGPTAVSTQPASFDTTQGKEVLSLAGAIPRDNVYASSDEFRGLLEKALNEGIDNLTDAERKQVKLAREQFKQIDEAFAKAEQQNEQQQPERDPERALLQRLGQNLMATGSSAVDRVGLGKSIIDVVASIGGSISAAIREEANNTPAPVSPFRDLNKQPLTPEEVQSKREWDRMSPVDQSLALGRKLALGAIAGSVEFPTQVLDPIVNPEKYGSTAQEAVQQTAEGFVNMIAEAPDQVAYLAEMVGAPSGLVKLVETIGDVLQGPRVLLTDVTRKELKEQAVNHMYANPESLPFALMLVKGASTSLTKQGKAKLGPESDYMVVKRSEVEEIGERIVKEKQVSAAEASAKVFEQELGRAEQLNKSLIGKEGLKERLSKDEMLSKENTSKKGGAKPGEVTKEPWEMTKDELAESHIVPEWGTRNQYQLKNPYREQIAEMKKTKKFDKQILRKSERWLLEQVLKDKPGYLRDNTFLTEAEMISFAKENGLSWGHNKKGQLIIAKDGGHLRNIAQAKSGRELGLALGYENAATPTRLKTHKGIISDALKEGKTPYEGWEKDYPDLAEKFGQKKKGISKLSEPPEGLEAPRPSVEKLPDEGTLQRNQRVQSAIAHHKKALEANDKFIKENPNMPQERVTELNEYQNRIREELAAYEAELASFTKEPAVGEKKVGGEKQGAGKEDIKPVTERGGGLGVFNIFKSLSEKFGEWLPAAKRKRGETELAPAPSFIVERSPKDIGLSANVRTPANVFGISEYQPKRYGEQAAKAAKEIILTDRDIMIETATRTETKAKILMEVDKVDWGSNGSKLFDHIENPKLDGQLQPKSLEAVKKIRKLLEADKQTIISLQRDLIRPSVKRLSETLYREKHNLKGKRLNSKQESEVAAIVEKELKKRIPDDWGINDYLPHMDLGNFKVYYREGKNVVKVGSGRTQFDALNVAMDHYSKHPEISPDAYFTKGKSYAGETTVRISDGKYRKILSDLADASGGLFSQGELGKILSGKIGRKASQQKFAGFLQERTGSKGYSKDLMRVLSIYDQTFTRWKKLTELNKKVVPTIENLNNHGQPRTAEYLQGMVDVLWGRSFSKASRLLDANLQNTPWLRDHVRPLALERWSNMIKGGAAWAYLKGNPRWYLLNSFQRLQTLLPSVTFAEYQSGLKLYRSAEGKAILERHGIRHLTGGKVLEAGRKPVISANVRGKAGRWAPETHNQQVAYLTMYERARKLGLSDKEANNFAFIEGNLRSQFVSLKTDQMPVARGPMTSLAFLFRRFQVKNLELGYDIIASKDFPGSAKWLSSQLLLGGAKSFARLGSAAGIGYISLQAYKAIKEEYGDVVAETIAWGLPSLLNMDMSYSITPVDVPYGETLPEKIGNLALGPPGQTALRVGRAMTDTKGTSTSAIERGARALTQTVPALKSGEAALAFLSAGKTWGERLDRGEYDFRDPAGRLKFKGDIKDIIAKAFGARTINEAEMELFTEALTEVQSERDKVLDNMAAQFLQLKDDKIEEVDYTKVYQWNEMFPDFPVNNKQIMTRAKSRYKDMDITRLQRLLRGSGKVFRKAEIFNQE